MNFPIFGTRAIPLPLLATKKVEVEVELELKRGEASEVFELARKLSHVGSHRYQRNGSAARFPYRAHQCRFSACFFAVRAVDAKFARPNPEAPMERATKSCFGLIAGIGSDLADRIACRCQLPPGQSEPQLSEEIERSKTCYSAKRANKRGARHHRPSYKLA